MPGVLELEKLRIKKIKIAFSLFSCTLTTYQDLSQALEIVNSKFKNN